MPESGPTPREGIQPAQPPFVSNPEISQWDNKDEGLPLIDQAASNERARGGGKATMTSPRSLVTLGKKKSRLQPSPCSIKDDESNLHNQSLDMRRLNEYSGS